MSPKPNRKPPKSFETMIREFSGRDRNNDIVVEPVGAGEFPEDMTEGDKKLKPKLEEKEKAALDSESAKPEKPWLACRGWRVSQETPAPARRSARARAVKAGGLGPRRSLTPTRPGPTARTMAPAQATSRSGSPSKAAPAPVLTTLRTDQPQLRSKYA